MTARVAAILLLGMCILLVGAHTEASTESNVPSEGTGHQETKIDRLPA